MELGQIIHNNPVGHDCPDYVKALLSHIRSEISRVYWNVNQCVFYDDPSADYSERTDSEPPLGIPGIEWWTYYNWGGSPDDPDWDQSAADRANFSFEGVEVRWYKYFGRGMNVNVLWTPEQWVSWFDRCISVIREYERQHKRY